MSKYGNTTRGTVSYIERPMELLWPPHGTTSPTYTDTGEVSLIEEVKGAKKGSTDGSYVINVSVFLSLCTVLSLKSPQAVTPVFYVSTDLHTQDQPGIRRRTDRLDRKYASFRKFLALRSGLLGGKGAKAFFCI